MLGSFPTPGCFSCKSVTSLTTGTLINSSRDDRKRIIIQSTGSVNTAKLVHSPGALEESKAHFVRKDPLKESNYLHKLLGGANGRDPGGCLGTELVGFSGPSGPIPSLTTNNLKASSQGSWV